MVPKVDPADGPVGPEGSQSADDWVQPFVPARVVLHKVKAALPRCSRPPPVTPTRGDGRGRSHRAFTPSRAATRMVLEGGQMGKLTRTGPGHAPPGNVTSGTSTLPATRAGRTRGVRHMTPTRDT